MTNSSMKLNNLRPAEGSRTERKRVGRGIASGFGKTAGRGHKGQKARSGGQTKVGFEGGQMPLQRRVPKVGFRSATQAQSQEVRLYQLASLAGDVVDLATLKEARIIRQGTRRVKLINTGEVGKAFTVRGIQLTAGAAKAIEAAGGKVE